MTSCACRILDDFLSTFQILFLHRKFYFYLSNSLTYEQINLNLVKFFCSLGHKFLYFHAEHSQPHVTLSASLSSFTAKFYVYRI